MLLNEGLNRMRDHIAIRLEKGQVGTGTTLPTRNDSDLQTSITASLTVLDSIALADKAITTLHTVSTTTGGTSSISENAVYFDDGSMLNRIVHSPITKDSNKILYYFTTVFFEAE